LGIKNHIVKLKIQGQSERSRRGGLLGRIWEFGNLGIWGSGNLGIWESANLKIWESGNLGIWEFGNLGIKNHIFKLKIRVSLSGVEEVGW